MSAAALPIPAPAFSSSAAGARAMTARTPSPALPSIASLSRRSSAPRRPSPGHLLLALLLGLLLPAAGCVDVDAIEDPAEPAPTTTKKKQPPKPTIQVVDVDGLPGSDRNIGPLDDDHLLIAVPAEWQVPPKSSKYLFRAQFDTSQPYPSVIVNGGEPEEGTPETLTRENVVAFGKALQKRLDAELAAAGASQIQEVRPVQLGDLYAVEYVRGAQSGGKKLDRLMLITALHGRQYTFELRAYRGTLAKFRPVLYSVASRSKIY